MAHTFISYSRRDAEIVNQIVEALRKAGVEVWIDREDIQTGNSWRVQIVEAIDTCDAFILMLSSASVLSANVQKEVILAADSGRKIFVMMLEQVKVPVEMRYPLAGLQFVDVQAVGFEKGLAQLTSALLEHLKKIRPAGDKPHRQTELVIEGVDLSQFTPEKQEQLLAFIANLANTDRSQLSIASMAAGSVHVFVEMPASVAYKLKTLALNRDSHFAELGIVSLKMIGDAHYIYIAHGAMLDTSTPRKPPLQSWLPWVLGLVVLILVLIFAMRPSTPPVMEEPSASPSAQAGVPSQTFTPTFTSTAAQTATPSLTPTVTAKPYQVLTGSVANDRSACNYGPGSLYLNNETLRQGLALEVFGRDINSGWAYVQADGYAEPCWVKLSDIQLNGEVESLEPVYPGKVTLPPSDYWPPPQNVYSARSLSDPNKLSIYWDAFILADGDLEGPGAPRYLLELWLCRNGDLTFNDEFAWENNIVVIDEAGCAEPSRGVIYLAEKHGYPGPVEIPWEPHP